MGTIRGFWNLLTGNAQRVKDIANNQSQFANSKLEQLKQDVLDREVPSLRRRSLDRAETPAIVDRAPPVDEVPASERPTKSPHHNALRPGRKLQGRFRYEITKCSVEGDQFNLYQGKQSGNDAKVEVQEFWLEHQGQVIRDRELETLLTDLDQLSRISFRNAEDADKVERFRIITPWDAFVDRQRKCGYIVTKYPEGLMSLKDYAKEIFQKHLEPEKRIEETRWLLQVILQSLSFLHSNVVHSQGQPIRGEMAHGNLTLETIFIQPKIQNSSVSNYLYLSHLGIWQNLFRVNQIDSWFFLTEAMQDDLRAVGKIAYCYLLGEIERALPNTEAEFDRNLQQIPDHSLKNFIKALCYPNVGHSPTFFNAREAEDFFLEAKRKEAENSEEIDDIEEEFDEAPNGFLIVAVLLALTAALLVGWHYLPKTLPATTSPTTSPPEKQKSPKETKSPEPSKMSFKGSDEVYKYAIANQPAQSAWKVLLSSQEISMSKNGTRISLDEYIRSKSKDRYQFNQTETGLKLEKEEELGYAFSLLESVQEPKKSENYVIKPVAIEGVVAFVSIDDSTSRISTKGYGKDTLREDELKQILTGKTEKRICISKESKSIVQDVLADYFKIDREQLENLDPCPSNLDLHSGDKNYDLGLAKLSVIFNQCKAFPLAIQIGEKTIQPLIRSNSSSPIDSELNLCSNKGGYEIDASKFGMENEKDKYPWQYSLYVAYRKDSPLAGKEFSEQLKTTEWQCLISELGLSPVISVDQPFKRRNCSRMKQ